MRKCRTVELKHVNQAFLDFCVNYHTPEREMYREAYESADMDEREEKAKEKVSQARSNKLSDVRQTRLSLVRPSAEAPVHNDSGGA